VGRPITHSLVKALRGVPGFDLLEDDWLLKIVGASVNLLWPEDGVVFERGTPGNALYVVLSGEVRVCDVVGGREVELARIGTGDYFGEMSLLLDSTHTKSVIAVEDIELLCLPKDSFARLLDQTPELDALVRRRLEERRASAARRIETDAPTS
jgi:CRP/FNR family transcriptional regulator, cyclic AMP receptor protein